MFDKGPHKAFHASEYNPVYHHRPVVLAILSHICKVKAFRKREIALYGGALPQAAQGILKLYIYLRSIEGAIRFVYCVWHRFVF